MNKMYLLFCIFVLFSAVMLCSCTDRTMQTPKSLKSSSLQAGDENMSTSNQITEVICKRKLSDIKFTADLTRDQVAAIWGPPDGKRGSGIAYIEYSLEDGQEVWLQFISGPPYRLQGAILLSPSTGQHKSLFEEQTDTLNSTRQP
jgi:hypothetical protein